MLPHKGIVPSTAAGPQPDHSTDSKRQPQDQVQAMCSSGTKAHMGDASDKQHGHYAVTQQSDDDDQGAEAMVHVTRFGIARRSCRSEQETDAARTDEGCTRHSHRQVRTVR